LIGKSENCSLKKKKRKRRKRRRNCCLLSAKRRRRIVGRAQSQCGTRAERQNEAEDLGGILTKE
jgi:hypothetical protein